MATLNSTELQSIRNHCAETQAINYTKAQLNAAAQAVETLMVNSASAISSAIDAVVARDL